MGSFRKFVEAKNPHIGDDDLDFKAFGFNSGDIIVLSPNQILLNPDWNDIENAEEAIKKSGLGPEGWARTVSFRKPIDVTLKDGKFWVEDGHHRWLAAKILQRKLKCRVEIKDNPVLALRAKGITVEEN